MATTDKHTANRSRPTEGVSSCFNRRQFLLYGSGTAVSVVGLASLPGMAWAQEAVVARYPRKSVATLGDLVAGEPIHFTYPSDDPALSASFLVKLDARAGGGIGPQNDIVAFNALCPHMGGPLMGQYRHQHRAIGPCPFHLTTFDLTHHGMVIAGHATESLPQVVLELDGDEIFATGVMGLIYGTYDSAKA